MAKTSKPKRTPAAKAKSPVKSSVATHDKNDLLPRVQKIIAGQLKKKPEEIVLSAGLQTDLSGDSLDALEIIFQLEEEFNIKIDEEAARHMATVQDIVSYVTKKVKSESPSKK
jgi:acyl carrier protein